jgi:cellulose synthase/poly-beta-1,6-N-acetylglucosamine synthase-like glycosyltransferase
MADSIMLISSILFSILFIFLIFILSVIVASRFIKRKNITFEPKVSIVIPAYNEEKNIENCIHSVFDSDYPKKKIEIIVIDDGSSDNTPKILKKYPDLKIFFQNHLGKVDALNLGTKKSSNEFVLTVDADTVIDKDCVRELLKPFADPKVGATTGNNHVKNHKSIIGTFQNVEYHFSNLMRNSFSRLFNTGIWFSGSLACYRKSALDKIGNFKRDTMAEDQDIALEMKQDGYKTINESTAFGHTIVPCTFKTLYKQRARWWIGTLQSIFKNKKLFSSKASPSILFLFVNQYWWSLYAFLSLPLIIYQINYWLPYNSQSLFSLTSYLFKWFSLMGPIYVIYKIPEWGVSTYSIFGVLSGLITTVIAISALKMFDKVSVKEVFAIFFYFPYTIVLNMIILVSLLRHKFWEKSFYLK